jgi:hypothetical protein
MLVPPCEDDDHGKARLRQEPWPETNSTLLAFVIRATPIFLFGQQGHLIHVSASARTEMRTKAITWVDSEKESGKFHSHSSIQPSTIRSGCLEEGADGRMWGKTQRAASDKFAIDRVHDRHWRMRASWRQEPRVFALPPFSANQASFYSRQHWGWLHFPSTGQDCGSPTRHAIGVCR